jgi:D-beta-D-heptose 7-phosphate kinase/D-beta-D-heptose 1-phosphate adenosyltransferase
MAALGWIHGGTRDGVLGWFLGGTLVPTATGQGEGRHGQLPFHANGDPAGRAIVGFRGREAFQAFFRLATTFTSVFIKWHVRLLPVIFPEPIILSEPLMPTPTQFFQTPEAFLLAHPEPGTLCFTNGCFDLIHPGHVQYLADARALGDFLVVGLNSDASVARLKGPSRPLQDESARAAVLLGLRSVDAVVRFDEDTPLELIRALQPAVLVKGGDYTPDTVVGRDLVEARGGRLVLIPFLAGYSTTVIEQRIKSGRGVTLE